MRFSPHTGDPDGLIPLLKKRPAATVLYVSSISTGAGGVWVSITDT
jgi:hypothetical protein